MGTPELPLHTRLRDELRTAMKARNRAEVSAIRSALATIDNAGSAGIHADAAGAIEASAAGLGTAEVQRRALSEADIAAIVRAEIDDAESAAADFETGGHQSRAAELRDGARLLRRVLELPEPGSL